MFGVSVMVFYLFDYLEKLFGACKKTCQYKPAEGSIMRSSTTAARSTV